jgi:hypothetical protein
MEGGGVSGLEVHTGEGLKREGESNMLRELVEASPIWITFPPTSSILPGTQTKETKEGPVV